MLPFMLFKFFFHFWAQKCIIFNMEENNEMNLDLAGELGASEQTSTQVLSLYIPNKDCYGNEFGTQRKWILEAARILAEIGGGVTIMPAVEGGWINSEGDIIWENPIVVYSYVKPDEFVKSLPKLRKFLHKLGRETKQGEIAVEFDGFFYRITEFDEEEENG